MKPIDSNKHSVSELENLRLENEKLKMILAQNGLADHVQTDTVLDSIPVAVWEEDFSEVKKFLDELAHKGVSDFNWYFSEHPEDVKHCISLIKVINVNEAALKMTGLDAVPGGIDHLPTHLNEESEAVFKNELVVLANGGLSFQSDAVMIDLEDRSMRIMFQLNVVTGHEHDLSRVLVTITDITNEVTLQEELDRTEIQWRTIFESLADGVMIVNRDLKIVKTNFSSLGRPTGEDPVGKSIIDEVIEEQREEAREFYQSILETGKANSAEHISAFSEGKSSFNVMASPMIVNGKVDHIVVVARNMTEQEKTERELFLSEARWQSIFNYASDLIYIVNRDFEVTDANKPALKVISNKMVGNKIKDVILTENAMVVTDMINEVFLTDKQLQTVIEIPEGEYKGHLYSCDISTLPNPEGESSAIIIARDITESKNHEKQVLDALIQGQERERKRVARELHDGLGQLFTALNLNMQLFKLRNKASLDLQAKEQLEELSSIAEKAISEVKAISKNLIPDALNHHGLVAAVKEVIETLDGGTANILLDIVDADKRYSEKAELTIFRALQEMLNNAVKYAAAETIHVQIVDHEDSLVLTVEDDGKGLESSEIDSGNGLQNTRARADALGGTFYIEGAPGKGTLAYIEIPITKEDQ